LVNGRAVSNFLLPALVDEIGQRGGGREKLAAVAAAAVRWWRGIAVTARWFFVGYRLHFASVHGGAFAAAHQLQDSMDGLVVEWNLIVLMENR
jgi:hypothetical protein